MYRHYSDGVFLLKFLEKPTQRVHACLTSYYAVTCLFFRQLITCGDKVLASNYAINSFNFNFY